MSKTIAIMQPYFLPYIGYWQLMCAVDQFVVYDNIKHTKKGWINRNRFLLNGMDETFTLPLKKDSDFLDIKDRYLSDNFDEEAKKLIRKIESAYKKAPYSNQGLELIRKCLYFQDKNLFEFIYYSINELKNYLNIDTELIVSSDIPVDHSLHGEDRIKAICQNLNACNYINPIGGIKLYDKESFSKDGINLRFINSRKVEYKQYNNDFVPWLSILDLLMFNELTEIKRQLWAYELI